jgi:hypothetical protein
MNLQQFINARNMTNNLQLASLIDMLGFRQGKDTKRAIERILKNKFYTVFDEKAFSRQFEVHDTFIEFRPIRPQDNLKELKAIRDYILLTGGEK